MGKWLLGICIALTGATLVATDADAKRLGGGRSVGTQRNVTPAPAKPAPRSLTAISPSRSACTPTRRRSRECSSRRVCHKWKCSTSPPVWSPCIAVFDFDRMADWRSPLWVSGYLGFA